MIFISPEIETLDLSIGLIDHMKDTIAEPIRHEPNVLVLKSIDGVELCPCVLPGVSNWFAGNL